MASFLFVCL
uniref:Uncharacterized protein n=1 Tax=Anguilla anguilla TaxID=7936 RepID=A0A0E9VZQ6_ANGAN